MQNERMWRNCELKPSYDVVIIGGGVHGLAAAYYLGKLGITNVAVLEKTYIGSGGSGRNTAILRANYRTAEGIPFYAESLRLYQNLAQELDFNLLFSQIGHLTLGHTDRSIATLRERARMNDLLGMECHLIDAKEVFRLEPGINRHCHPPVMGALYHPPGGTIRHDAVVWGYARGADRMGAEIHQMTEVTAILKENGRITGVQTNRGRVSTSVVLSCVAGYSSIVGEMAGVELPLVTHQLQALVTEPYKPYLNHVIVSSTLHVYISQTDRGEFVCGSEIDPYSSYSLRSSMQFIESLSAHLVELIPDLAHAAIMRQWVGLSDMTPDFAPILTDFRELEGFYMTCGWGTWGFKAGPASGRTMAEFISTGKAPELIAPLGVGRFLEHRLIGEKAAAAVSS